MSVFSSLDDFVAQPRITSQALSPDGQRLILTVSEPNDEGNAYVSSLWDLPTGRPGSVAAPVRLTRGAKGDTLVGFTASGDVLFTSERESTGQEGAEPTVLLRLPRGGGEAFPVARRVGGFSALVPARESGHLLFVSGSFPSALSLEDDASLADDRARTKTSAILHEGYPVRYWNHDLGPQNDQIFLADPPDPAHRDAELALHRVSAFGPEQRLESFAVNASATLVLASVTRTLTGTSTRSEIVAIDVESGFSRVLASVPGYDLGSPVLSLDGRVAIVTKESHASADRPLTATLAQLDLASGEVTDLFPDFTDWPTGVDLSADGAHVVFTTDHRGGGAIWRGTLATGAIELLTHDRIHYADVAVDPVTGDIHALADAVDAAPAPVVLRAETHGGHHADRGERPALADPRPVPSPIAPLEIPGTLTEVETTAEDGTGLRAWLCLPAGASAEPAPLLLWIHGGPMGSWNGWTWRWNPWTAVARGYAVLLPDPAISTGYGQAMIDRGWGQLGGTPFDDIMRLTRAALERPDVDETRKAALGGSYGGYMANWVAGHTGDFFDCIVTHASLWNLDHFRVTTDTSEFWSANLTDEHNALYNPQLFARDITAPMLVIHGDQDYRVPIGEGLSLWYELLTAQNKAPGENKNLFLYFPDECHWILSPNNSKIWYETVLAYVDQHVLGEEFARPRLLG